MKISDEVLVETWEAYAKSSGLPRYSSHEKVTQERILKGIRAAADVLVPVVLKEALAEPTNAEIAAQLDKARNYGSWSAFKDILISRFYRLTASPDPCREAVRSALSETGLVQGSFLDRPEIEKAIDKIVAAVEGKRVANG